MRPSIRPCLSACRNRYAVQPLLWEGEMSCTLYQVLHARPVPDLQHS